MADSIFEKIRGGLKKTRDNISSRVGGVLAAFKRIDEDFYDEMEETLILCDIDYCKGYNDTVGHQGGDDVLRAVGLLLQGFARRAGEMAARYGGAEFALILPSTDASSLAYIGERLRAAVETAELPHPESAISPFLTLSIGGASIQPSADSTPEDLIATADRALYQAKERGSNRMALLTELVRAGISSRNA